MSNLPSRIAHIKKTADLLIERKKQSKILHFEELENGFYRVCDKIYHAYPVAKRFINSDAKYPQIMGPFGSGKTTASIIKIIKTNALFVPRNKNDGVIRAKTALVRNTYAELKTTTIKSWDEWADGLPKIHNNETPPRESKYAINFKIKDASQPDGWKEGTLHLEVVFLALDKPNQVKKLKSFDLTNVYFNELSEIPYVLYEAASGRTGRYPVTQLLDVDFNSMTEKEAQAITDRYSIVMSDTNPPPEGSWLQLDWYTNPKKGCKLFKQPPGLIKNDKDEWVTNPEAENLRGLRAGYYLEMTSKTQEFINVYALGNYGIAVIGEGVYRKEYNDDLHSALDDVELTPGTPVYAGIDFGTTPAVVFAQYHPITGQIKVIYEAVPDRMGFDELAESVINHMITTVFEPAGCVLEKIFCDPSGRAGSDNDLKTKLDRARHFGLPMQLARTNAVNSRLDAVKWHLNGMVNGKPRMVINRAHCKKLREGFLGHYCYKEIAVPGGKILSPAPLKNSHSHVHDALQYLLLHFYTSEQKQNDLDKRRELAKSMMG